MDLCGLSRCRARLWRRKMPTRTSLLRLSKPREGHCPVDGTTFSRSMPGPLEPPCSRSTVSGPGALRSSRSHLRWCVSVVVRCVCASLMGCSPVAVSTFGVSPATPSINASRATRTTRATTPSRSSPGDRRSPTDGDGGIDLADPLSAASLMAEIEILASPAMRGRGSATLDEQRAAIHLASELDRAGIEPLGDPPLRMQRFSHGTRTSQNVLGIIRPSGDAAAAAAAVIVLGAHYDHLGVKGGETYFGADDNASGTAAVLGVARALIARRHELARPVVIAFFGAEEVGMLGSKAFVTGGPIPKDRVFAMINVDMVGRPLTDQPMLLPLLALTGIDASTSVGVDGLRGRPGFEQVVRNACSSEHHRAITIDDLPKPLQATIEGLSRGRGDNWSFEQAGIPSIFFSSSESSDYHQLTDTIATLSANLVETRARVVLRTVVGISRLNRP